LSNAKPRLTPWSRQLLVDRVLAGRPAAHVAAEMGVSRATAYKWLARFRAEGSAGLVDRSSRPRTSPHRTDPATEAVVIGSLSVLIANFFLTMFLNIFFPAGLNG